MQDTKNIPYQELIYDRKNSKPLIWIVLGIVAGFIVIALVYTTFLSNDATSADNVAQPSPASVIANPGDTPVAVTFCPLCNSAIVFDRRFQGETLEFGASGLLRNSGLIMYDRQIRKTGS